MALSTIASTVASVFPTEAWFDSMEAGVDACHQAANNAGYALTILRTRKCPKTDEILQTVLVCDRHGHYVNKKAGETGIRSTNTRRTGCLMQVTVRQPPYQEQQQYIIVDVNHEEHNHEASSDLRAHAVARKVSPDEEAAIQTQLLTGSAPRTVLAALRAQNPRCLIGSRDVYNIHRKALITELAGRTPIQTLYDHLSCDPNWEVDVKLDARGHIQHILYAHVDDVAQLRRFPEVLLMDCTYKTNS